MTWGRRWRGVPRRIRFTVGVGAGVLAYFTSLTVFDPLAAVLLWLRRAAGLHLAILVLVTDALANGYALYGLSGYGSSDGIGIARVSQAVISAMAMCALAAAPRVRPWLRPPDSTTRCAVR